MLTSLVCIKWADCTSILCVLISFLRGVLKLWAVVPLPHQSCTKYQMLNCISLIIMMLRGQQGISFSVWWLDLCPTAPLWVVLMRDYMLCGFSLMRPIPIIYLTVTPYDPSNLPFSRCLLLNCPSNGNMHFYSTVWMLQLLWRWWRLFSDTIHDRTSHSSFTSFCSSGVATDLWSALAAGGSYFY